MASTTNNNADPGGDMTISEKKVSPKADDVHSVSTSTNEDDKVLEQLGYVPSFKREFSNWATVRTFLGSSNMV